MNYMLALFSELVRRLRPDGVRAPDLSSELDLKEQIGFSQMLWETEARAGSHARIAEAIYNQHSLPPAALTLIPNLAEMLASLQKASFFLGASSALKNIQSANAVQSQPVETIEESANNQEK